MKNVSLLSLKKKKPKPEGRTYQKLRLSGGTRGSFHPRLLSSPLFPLHSPLLRLIRLLILYFAFLSSYLFSHLSTAHPRSLHGHRSRAYATLKSLQREVPRVSARINSRKRKSVQELRSHKLEEIKLSYKSTYRAPD